MSGRIETSYARQADWEAKALDLPSCYCRPDSVDAWRHRRMRETVLPLVTALPRATWMTVGDGSYGSDAHFLQGHGVDVVATSITDSALRIAHERGYVRNIRIENAESLSRADDSCDFVLCKESYHHFSRPAIAFYEMFRVARKAVVLIEPIEGGLRILDGLKVLFKRLVRGDDSTLFERSGNFVYRVNVGEILKMATGLGAPCAAVKRFNDFYIPPIQSPAVPGPVTGVASHPTGRPGSGQRMRSSADEPRTGDRYRLQGLHPFRGTRLVASRLPDESAASEPLLAADFRLTGLLPRPSPTFALLKAWNKAGETCGACRRTFPLTAALECG